MTEGLLLLAESCGFTVAHCLCLLLSLYLHVCKITLFTLRNTPANDENVVHACGSSTLCIFAVMSVISRR